MNKVLVIVGPTAIGKSTLGVELAKQFNGEIISGDSIQVYQGLDVGSGKIMTNEMAGIKHHGIDILAANDKYSVCDFQINCRKYIDDISARGKLPIIVGGTGLYIKAAIYDYHFENQEELNVDELQIYTNQELYDELLSLDPKSLETIHVNNRQRLIRALALARNDTLKSDGIDKQKHELVYDTLIIGLTTDRQEVYNRINQRVDLMMEDGLLQEVDNLLKNHVEFDMQSMQGIGYRELANYYNKGVSLEDTVELIKRNTRRFAKRQYTWFNNQTPIKWFDINDKKQLVEEVNAWIKN